MSKAPPTLTLHSWSLLSKFGFNDGDVPDEILDYMFEAGVNPRETPWDWHDALRAMVRKHLLPALAAEGHEVEVYDIDTAHNPIRADKIDGVVVDSLDRDQWPTLTPEYVTVEWADVAHALGAQIDEAEQK
jgi:hypothetical protein